MESEVTRNVKTELWNGTPVEYRGVRIDPGYNGIIFVQSTAYSYPDGDLRYVALARGQVVAVEISRANNFSNMVVEPLFDGNLTAYFPQYERRDGKLVYSVPVVDLR
jgi:hypothetical protein